MQNSVIMRRVLTLLIATILLSAALTTLFYSLTSNVVFTRISTQVYRNNAAYLAEKSLDYSRDDLSSVAYRAVLESAPNMLDAIVAIRFASWSSSYYVNAPKDRELSEEDLSELSKLVADVGLQVPEAGYVAKHVYLGSRREDMLMVAYPIMLDDYSSGGRSVGGMVFIFRSFEAIRASQSSLNFSLIFASSLVFLLMVIPAILAVSAILRPLRSVRNVALAMANGNFALRADTSERGEIGELAVSINDLASALDRSISALMVERNRLQQILDGLSEGILAIDADLQVTHINPASRALFKEIRFSEHADFLSSEADEPEGMDESHLSLRALEDEAIGRRLSEQYRAAMREQRNVSSTFVVAGKSILLQVAPLTDNKGQSIGAVGLFRDITAAEKLEQTRRDYVANVSHELRTPLTALRGLIEPLSDGLVTAKEDRMRYYGIILNETLRLSRLIDDMLELSRLQAGTLSLKLSVFDLSDVLDNLREKYAALAEQSQVSLHFPDDAHIPLIYGNADRTEQILVILIDNAFKFTPAGGSITIALLDCGKKLEVSVQDSGKGIVQSDIQHIFERFYKAEKSRGKSGTGLGLSIAKEIMKAMGESIWAVSKPGQGARFTFTLSKAEAREGSGAAETQG